VPSPSFLTTLAIAEAIRAPGTVRAGRPRAFKFLLAPSVAKDVALPKAAASDRASPHLASTHSQWV
jgi:hypothetical protein